MKNCVNEIRSVFKYNLELIKLILETWKTCIEVPYEVINQKLQLPETSQKLDVGVHLAATTLANNLAPWQNEANFLKNLCRILNFNTHRNVYQPCSEVLGMSLKFLNQDEKFMTHFLKFKEYLNKCLTKLSSNDDKFAYCIQGIGLHYPSIADSYLCKLVGKLNVVQGNFKCIYLKIFLSRIEQLHSINELSSINFESLLLDENLETQVLTLHIIEKSISYLQENALLNILTHVSKFVSNTFVVCRTVMYNIFIFTYTNYEHNSKIAELSRDILLQGLVDKESVIQEKLLKFWSDHLPKNVDKTFLHLLNKMYKASIEEHYVCYSSYLLLTLILTTKEYSEKIFANPLHDCEFQEYNLTGDWRRQYASMTPLFVSSLHSQETSGHITNVNILRSTVSTLEFQPTQVLAESVQHINPSSSLLFSFTEEGAGKSMFKDPNVSLSKTNQVRSRRFTKDKSKVSRHFAFLETKKSIKQEELRKERVMRSERNVKPCRKYRVGDYPDVEIPLSSVINPLQILAFCDSSVARHFYSSLFVSLIKKINEDTKQDYDFAQNIHTAINYILNNSIQFATNTIGTFLDIALMCSDLKQFHPNIITTASEESGLLSVGSLVLEKYLSSSIDEPPPSKKGRGVENQQTNYWVKLAELYKEMNEWDVVSSIFLEKMNCSEIVLHAIEAESTGHWRAAQESYAQVIQQDVSEYRRDFYYESYFKTFAALGEWDDLSNVICHSVCTNKADDPWSYLWDNDWNQQKLLPWFITSELRNTLSGLNRNLFSSINNFLKEPEKYLYLQSNFGEELAMLCLLQNDVDTAKYYLNNTITNWLENWSHINPLFINLRATTILNLKGVIDVYSFINFINSINVDNFQLLLEDVLKAWENTSLDGLESLLRSETVTVYRNQFISVVEQKLSSMVDEEEIKPVLNDLIKHKSRIYINLIEHALKQENYYVARKYVKHVSKFKLNSKFNCIENAQWSLALSKILFYLSKTMENQLGRVSKLVDSWKQLGSFDHSATDDDVLCCLVKRNQHIHELTQQIYMLTKTDLTLLSTKQNDVHFLLGGISVTSPETIWDFGVETLKNSLYYCENEIQEMMNNDNLKVYSHMAEAYLKLAYSTQNKETCEETFIISTLRAMKLGSAEGKQLFPCLLNKNLLHFKTSFQAECSQIPTWMFLNWIPQLLANLETNCIFAISDIVLQIAKMYPQAIMYSYRLSKETYKLESDVESARKKIIRTLDDLLLSTPLVDTFLKAFASVILPTNVLMYYLKKLQRAQSEEQFRSLFQNLLDEAYPTRNDFKDPKNLQGPMFKQISKYESKLKEISKGKFDLKRSCEKLVKILEEVENLKYVGSIKLADYSPWLSNFQATELREILEIPGQYSGHRRPLIQYHTKIMGFAPSVLVYPGSIRAPIRITILGNDAKEYNYLIKYGEDLRQDQRIEQVFSLMNNILNHNINCNKRQMHIQNYQVIPLNSRLGMIEWLNNTKELKKLIYDALESTETEAYKRIESSYTSWIEKASPRNKNALRGEKYGNAYIHHSRVKTITNYEGLVNSVPSDILRRSFWNISINSEGFFALRHKFTVSYAVMCVAHWLLGIGDRHLSNIMISLQTGEPIGIDFGCAFGVSTQMLAIPELVPFRLTPHILNLLQPFNEHDLLQESMIHCLRAFRKSSDILLSTMRVFIMEKSIDWLEFACLSEKTSKNTVTQEWYPTQKIEHAKRKLEGVNPMVITIEELNSGHKHRPKFLEAFIKVVESTPSENFRSKMKGNLSEEDQVKCLIDQATDYNILGRMFAGWYSWV